ncbi:MAG: S-layer homology domain-containing protein, partial [Candidatus Peribacteraceae bacterium]|nr:S-layer homology domain-containing protein [Candidatus Peribacteraceae bacterium]
QTFTYTPTTVGTKLIAVANTGGLPNPADVIYTVTADVIASSSSSLSSSMHNGGGASSSSSSSISSSSSSRGRVVTSSSASSSEPIHLAPLASPLCSTLSQTSVPQEKGLLSLMLEGRKVTFGDVPASAWFTLPMFSLIQGNVMSGYRDSAGVLTGKMQPERLVSFEEMAKMILLSSGRSIDAVSADATNLSAQKSWSNKYVRLAEDTNLSLYTKNLIVTSAASRGAAVRTILEALGIPRQSAATSPFKDLDTKNPFYQDILTAVSYGIITGDIDASGKSTGKVRPTDPLKRAELATIILRAVKVMCQ